MAFSIVIKDDNKDIFTLLKNRLSLVYPDAYITLNNSENLMEELQMSDYSVSISNNRLYKLSSEEIPLYTISSDGKYIIDCSLIQAAISKVNKKINPGPSVPSFDSKMHLLISYAYIEEREQSINETFSFIKENSDYPIRIDLMSGIRMSTSVKTGLDSGSLTDLLKDTLTSKFRPERILEYLNPEINGYLTPGKPDNSDDVFEYGIKTCIKLLKNLKALSYSSDIDIKSLVVVEGFRISELSQLLPYFDTIHFLLPTRMCKESLGITKTINEFRMQLTSNQQLIVHYCAQKEKEITNETIKV